MDIFDILKGLGIFTIGTISIVSVIGYVTKSVFNNYLNKRVELYKNELQVENEKFRAELERQNTEHQIRFSSLHADRMNAIKSLHTGFTSIKSELIKYNKDKEKHTIPFPENPVIRKLEEVHGLFALNKLYFSENLASQIEKYLGSTSTTATIAVAFSKQRDKFALSRNDDPEKREMEQTEFIDLMDESKILVELEKEFRKLIGVGE